MIKKFYAYFSRVQLTEGLIIGFLGSAFIYLSYFGDSCPLLESIFALLFFYLLIKSQKGVWFWSGFSIALLWFWWIGISFIHYKIPWLLPFADFTIALIYGIYFYIFAYISEKVAAFFKYTYHIEYTLKALSIFIMSYIHPFGFNWFKPELILVHTPFGVDKFHFFLLLTAIVIFISLKKSYRIIFALLPLALALYPQKPKIINSIKNNPISIITTDITIDKKWNPNYLNYQINMVINDIKNAIKSKKRVVILPESVLPLFLNMQKETLNKILKLSNNIDIVVGSLYYDIQKRQNHNSAYFFHRGKYKVADKVILVPFGESNPLPHWMGKIVNKIFFDGAPDYLPAKKPTDFIIDKEKYRIAVCYEATSEELYRGNPKRIIAISNDAWFTPSIEPTLQKLLLEYYSRKYRVTIFHSINVADSYIIKP